MGFSLEIETDFGLLESRHVFHCGQGMGFSLEIETAVPVVAAIRVKLCCQRWATHVDMLQCELIQRDGAVTWWGGVAAKWVLWNLNLGFNLKREAHPLATLFLGRRPAPFLGFNLKREAHPLATPGARGVDPHDGKFQSQARSPSPGHRWYPRVAPACF